VQSRCAISYGLAVILAAATSVSTALAADVPCQFQAQDRVEAKISVGDTVIWSGTLTKAEIKTIDIPEGAFTVLAEVPNPNLKTKETVRSSSHTDSCKGDRPLLVPLFSDQRQRR
jgi:hypothetical protein